MIQLYKAKNTRERIKYVVIHEKHITFGKDMVDAIDAENTDLSEFIKLQIDLDYVLEKEFRDIQELREYYAEEFI